ncbi:MAG: 3-methylornithyl-N6-L-lysine dehydrogenase PylD [bacterium]|nr:3-methylornithyl-N6-L-lysine dehydrogenase PylD [bacterium]
MTRLKNNDIKDIAKQLNAYDKKLLQKTRHTLRGIACFALGFDEEKFCSLLDSVSVGVVRIRSGEGIIENFSETVSRIVQHIGFNTFVSSGTDVAGIAEAVKRGAEVIMMADDHRFIALDIRNGRIVDNTEATAKVFVAGLELMAGGLNGQKVLIIGCGPVGREAALAALQRGADVSVFDIDGKCSLNLVQGVEQLTGKTVTIEQTFENALPRHHLLIETTNVSDVIDAAVITPETYIAAPGMPLGLTSAAMRKISTRLLHDPLQLGVAMMAIEAAHLIMEI